MCDTPKNGARTGWMGWDATPPPPVGAPDGPWCDLTHGFSARVPRSSMFPPPEISKIAEMPAQPFHISRLDTIVHIGTHVDAPNHFFADGPGMDAIPLDRLTGAGVVVHMDVAELTQITAADLQAATPAIRPGDIVAIHTGWEAHWGSDSWDRHPSLSQNAADWLVARGVRLLAVDMVTPDMAFDQRPPDFDFAVHCTLLGHGVLIAEQVANLGPLAGSRVEFMFCPVPIEDCDGAPARVLARRTA